MLYIDEVKWYSDLQLGWISLATGRRHGNAQSYFSVLSSISVLFEGSGGGSGCYSRFFTITSYGQKTNNQAKDGKPNLVEVI